MASAGAGLGTSAFFSDQETFENNSLTAGTLDLTVDWEEHYSNWSADEADAVGDVLMTEGNPSAVTAGYVGLPDPENPLIAIPDGDLESFMNTTAIEASPDTNDDGIQDPIPSDTTACEYLADVGNDDLGLDPTGPRTNSGDTNVDGETAPLINLQDVKPGDFGELTLSFHLCDNPGYVWLTGSLDYNAENDVTEPEGDDPDENNDPGEFDPMADGELLNAIQTRLWYDNGDNVVGDGETYLTPAISLADLFCLLGMNNGVRLCADESGAVVGDPNGNGGTGGDTSTCPVAEGYDSVHTSGTTVTVNNPMTDGSEDIEISDNPFCSDFGLLQGLKTDEADEGTLPVSGTVTYETAYGTFEVTTEALSDDANRIISWSFTPAEGVDLCVGKVIVKGGNGANVYSYDNPGGEGDTNFAEDLAVGGAGGDDGTDLRPPPNQGGNPPRISHADFCLKPTDTGQTSGGNGDTGETEQGDTCCFEPSTAQYLGFAWWLPVDHANELQSDSVGFDLGFYTEQCRHNDGSGMNNENVDPEEVDA